MSIFARHDHIPSSFRHLTAVDSSTSHAPITSASAAGAFFNGDEQVVEACLMHTGGASCAGWRWAGGD